MDTSGWTLHSKKRNVSYIHRRLETRVFLFLTFIYLFWKAFTTEKSTAKSFSNIIKLHFYDIKSSFSALMSSNVSISRSGNPTADEWQ